MKAIGYTCWFLALSAFAGISCSSTTAGSGHCVVDLDCPGALLCIGGQCRAAGDDGADGGNDQDGEDGLAADPTLSDMLADDSVGPDDTTSGGDDVDCPCPSGPCCQSCQFQTASVVCNPSVLVEHACHWGTDCGNDVAERIEHQNCSGSSSACDGQKSFGPWAMKTDCPFEQPCDSVTLGCVDKTSCHGYPRMIFTPEHPIIGDKIRVDVMDTQGWVWIGLISNGPCGAVAMDSFNITGPPPLAIWPYQTKTGVTGGTYAFTFTRDNNTTPITVISKSVTVEGATGCK